MSLDAQRSWECFCCCGRRAPPAAVSESCRVTYGVLAFCDSWKISRSKKDANHQIGEITLSESKHDAASRSLDYVLTVLEELTILTYFFTFLLAQHCSWPMVQDARSKAWKQYESNLVGVSTLSWTPSRSLGKKHRFCTRSTRCIFPTSQPFQPTNHRTHREQVDEVKTVAGCQCLQSLRFPFHRWIPFGWTEAWNSGGGSGDVWLPEMFWVLQPEGTMKYFEVTSAS